jgi:hypothetical protein
MKTLHEETVDRRKRLPHLDETHCSIIRIWGTGFGDTHPQIRIGSTVAAPVTSREANGVVEFRVLVPPIPAGQSQVTIDFTLDGTYFPGTGLNLPVVPSSQ